MTSLGAPGIVPVSDQARSFSVIEAILGVLYLAVLISRLMGAYRPRYQADYQQPPGKLGADSVQSVAGVPERTAPPGTARGKHPRPDRVDAK
jgi:hypothetical protein